LEQVPFEVPLIAISFSYILFPKKLFESNRVDSFVDADQQLVELIITTTATDLRKKHKFGRQKLAQTAANMRSRFIYFKIP